MMCAMTHIPLQLCIFSKKITRKPPLSVSSHNTKMSTKKPIESYIAIDIDLISESHLSTIVEWAIDKKLYFYGSANTNSIFIKLANKIGYTPFYKTLTAACKSIETDFLNTNQLMFFERFDKGLASILSASSLEEQLSHLFQQKIILFFENDESRKDTECQYILKHNYEGHNIDVVIKTQRPISKIQEKWLYQFLKDWLQHEELNAILIQWKSIFNSLDEACIIANEFSDPLFKNKASVKLQKKLRLNNRELAKEIFKNTNTKLSTTKPFKRQINYQDKDGFLKKCHLEVKIQKTYFNNKTYYAIIIKDITDVVSLQQQILDLSKFSDAGIVGSSIAHEINNPLGGLISYLQLMQMSQKNTELLSELNELLSSAEQCKQIAKKLLSFSRKTDPSSFTQIKISEWARSYFKKKQQEHPAIDWQIDINNSDTFILYEREALEVTFSGIIKNCIEATANNPTNKTIKVSLSENEHEVLIHINDNGFGMNNSTQNQALNPFFTTKRGRGNFGLGLTISYHLVRQSSGQLNFYSKPNVGTSVFLTFPRLDLNDQ